MKQNNAVLEKSLCFAVRVVNLCRYLQTAHDEHVLSRQILRSGTSIGANIREAQHGQSRRDFLSKMNIALKEATETEYWIELLFQSNYLNEAEYKSIITNSIELKKILASISISTKEKYKKPNS